MSGRAEKSLGSKKTEIQQIQQCTINIYILYAIVLLFFLIYCFQSKDELATSLASLGNYLSGSLYLHSYQMAWVQG